MFAKIGRGLVVMDIMACAAINIPSLGAVVIKGSLFGLKQ
jgi:hypothetical protein